MIAAARIMVVPGRTGAMVPIKPTAKSTIVKNHQNSSMVNVEWLKGWSVEGVGVIVILGGRRFSGYSFRRGGHENQRCFASLNMTRMNFTL